jgi:hypothetical protein
VVANSAEVERKLLLLPTNLTSGIELSDDPLPTAAPIPWEAPVTNDGILFGAHMLPRRWVRMTYLPVWIVGAREVDD